MDFIKKLKPQASQATLVWSGRIVTVVFMTLAAAWAPVIVRFETLWEYLQSVLAYLSPPIVACFVMGVFWKRANRHAAFLTLIIGHLAAVGIWYLKDYRQLIEFHFLYIPPLLMTFCVVLIILISLASEMPDPAQVRNHTWTVKLFREEREQLAKLPWYQNYRILSTLLLVATAVVVGLFW